MSDDGEKIQLLSEIEVEDCEDECEKEYVFIGQKGGCLYYGLREDEDQEETG